jgi:hypothetical protein
MISALSNLGQLWFMVFTGRLNAAVFIGFLARLLRVAKWQSACNREAVRGVETGAENRSTLRG